MAAHQVPPSLGFSRQEHWSGLPFPSPMHESEKWKWSHVQPLATPWTAAYQAPPSMGFSRQEYWSGVPLPSPTRMWDECNCVVVWAFFGIAFLWDWNENWLFQSCGHCWVFQICWHIECSKCKMSLHATSHHNYSLKLVEFFKYVFSIKVMDIKNTKVKMTWCLPSSSSF